jgi:hypothetical protein
MNAFQLKELEGEPFNEVCDCCGRTIYNWEECTRSYISLSGTDIQCLLCRQEERRKIAIDLVGKTGSL